MNIKNRFLLVLIIVLAFACNNKINSKDGKLISNTICKDEKNFTFDTNKTCVEYSYDAETKTLNVKHINTAFNCCPKALYIDVIKDGDVVKIEETERSQDCNCMCLYDIELEVYNIELQTYKLKFKEPYVADEYELFFEINLLEKPSGSFCLQRSEYPWGQ